MKKVHLCSFYVLSFLKCGVKKDHFGQWLLIGKCRHHKKYNSLSIMNLFQYMKTEVQPCQKQQTNVIEFSTITFCSTRYKSHEQFALTPLWGVSQLCNHCARVNLYCMMQQPYNQITHCPEEIAEHTSFFSEVFFSIPRLKLVSQKKGVEEIIRPSVWWILFAVSEKLGFGTHSSHHQWKSDKKVFFCCCCEKGENRAEIIPHHRIIK